MINKFEPAVNSVIQFVAFLGVKSNSVTVEEKLQHHPDWPSLLCVSDILTDFDIPNAASKTEPGNIDQIPTPFLTFLTDAKNQLVVVTNVSEEQITYYHSGIRNPSRESRKAFIDKWDGVFLIAEPHENSIEPYYFLNKRKIILNRLMPIVLGIISLVLMIYKIHQKISFAELSVANSVCVYSFFTICLLGVIVCSFLVWHEVDRKSFFIKAVCDSSTSFNCDAILSGEKSKLFSWLSWSEVGLFYFAGGLLTLLFSGNNISIDIKILIILNLLALPYTVFSIYYQWIVVKQWCPFCLAVQILLVVGAVNGTINTSLAQLFHVDITSISKTFISYIIPVLIWYIIKHHLSILQKGKEAQKLYARLRYNPVVFSALTEQKDTMTSLSADIGIVLGNPDAPNKLIIACRTSCSACGMIQPEIDNLLNKYPSLFEIKIIFASSEEENSLTFTPTAHILALAEKRDEKLLRNALNDWYSGATGLFEQYSLKYPVDNAYSKQNNKIVAMNTWLKSMRVFRTPTVFLNGKEIPDSYNIEDIPRVLKGT
jgi:hypothetical protein